MYVCISMRPVTQAGELYIIDVFVLKFVFLLHEIFISLKVFIRFSIFFLLKIFTS